MEARNVLSPEQIAAVDASYRPIDGFDHWAGLTVDETTWNEFAAALADARARASPGALDGAIRGAMRAAAFDSGAIEGLYPADRGFTITAAFQAAMWEAGLHERGEATAELVTGQLRGYELALDIATKRMAVTEAWIRALHEVISAGQHTYEVRTAVGKQDQALPRGVYKTASNHVLLPNGDIHAYAPPGAVGSEMHRLVDELTSSVFEAAHPVLQAAYAHHAFTQIHPFADGNGRVARVLASVFLLRAESIPLVVFADQREQYLGVLRRADDGEGQLFVDFVRDRAVDTLDLLTNLLGSDAGPSIERLTALYRLGQEVTEVQLAEAVVTFLREQVNHEVAALLTSLSPSVGGEITWVGTGGSQLAGHRLVRGLGDRPTSMVVQLVTAPPREAAANLYLQPLLANDPAATMPVVIYEAVSGTALRARISDIVPSPGEAVLTRLRAWLQRLIAQALSDLVRSAGS